MKTRFLIIFVLSVFFGNAQLVTYPPSSNITPDNPYIYESPHYEVTLVQNEKKVEDFVYCMTPMHTTNNSKSTSWANFSFQESVKVIVKNKGRKIEHLNVLPRSADIKINKENDSIASFTIKKPGHYSVEFEKGIFIDHPLLIFANPLEENIPDKNDPNVRYFEKGYHEIGDTNVIADGSTVYLEGGAYVMGQFQAENVANITIKGRGIISGEQFAARTKNHMVTMRNATNIEMEGITMIHAPRYFVSLNGNEHHLNNLKMMGWWFSTDGISAGENTLIENCFFKVNDDAVKLYRNNTAVRNCTIWQLENGAPFMISWNGRADFGNVRVSDIDIIRVEHHWDNENLAVVCAVHGGQAEISDFLFEDIRIDNSKWRMFHLVTRPNRWGKWNPERGSLSNFTFRNIEYYEQQTIKSLIMGHDYRHPVYGIHFDNIKMNGLKLTNKNSFLIIDDVTTSGITLE